MNADAAEELGQLCGALAAHSSRDEAFAAELGDELAARGYDPVYGARPLRRLMQKEIDDRLARAILSGEVRDGQAVRVSLAEGGDALEVVNVGHVPMGGFDPQPGADRPDDDVVEAELLDD